MRFVCSKIPDLLHYIDAYFHSFNYSIPTIENDIIKKKVKLVVIDSIASLFRKEYGASVLQSVVERNNILLHQAAILKDLSQTYDIVVSFSTLCNFIVNIIVFKQIVF